MGSAFNFIKMPREELRAEIRLTKEVALLLFHVAPRGLAVGDIVKKGSWGKQTTAFKSGGRSIEDHASAILLMWEAALEAARLVSHPSAPSRLGCVFASNSMETAAWFRDKYRPESAIYSVAPVEVSPNMYTGDFGLLGTGQDPFVTRIARNAHAYWSPLENTGHHEVLIGSDVQILCLVS